jgi:hypothetical protein
MRTVRPLPSSPEQQAEGLSALFQPFTARLRAIVQYAGEVAVAGAVYSMGYVDDGMRRSQAAAPVLIRTTAEGSAILEEPVSTDTERDPYYSVRDVPQLDDVRAYVADAPAIVAAVNQLAGRDPVLKAALAQSPLTLPGSRGAVTL